MWSRIQDISTRELIAFVFSLTKLNKLLVEQCQVNSDDIMCVCMDLCNAQSMYICLYSVRSHVCMCMCVFHCHSRDHPLGWSMLKGMPSILALRIASHTYFEFTTDIKMCCVPRYLFSSCSVRTQAVHGILCLSRHSVLHAASLQCVINCRRVVVRTECFNYTIPRRSQFSLHKWTVWIPSYWFGSDVCLHLAWQCIL